MSGVAIPWIIKMIIAGAFDLLDFIFGWIPGVGEVIDALGIVLAIFLWGGIGVIAAWELIALVPLNVVDMWIPTVTLIGLMSMGRR